MNVKRKTYLYLSTSLFLIFCLISILIYIKIPTYFSVLTTLGILLPCIAIIFFAIYCKYYTPYKIKNREIKNKKILNLTVFLTLILFFAVGFKMFDYFYNPNFDLLLVWAQALLLVITIIILIIEIEYTDIIVERIKK